MVDDRTLPHDELAEQYVIAACLNSPRLVEEIRLTPDDFYHPRHGFIWQTMQKLAAEGIPTDVATVRNKLIATDLLRQAGETAYLLELNSITQATANHEYHAHIIIDLALKRESIKHIQTSLNEFFTSDEAAETLVMRAENRLSQTPIADDTTEFLNLDELTEKEDPPDDWIIPDLLTRGDRLVLTGTEGMGKSVLMRQMAVCAAAGIQPFTGKYCKPRNVVLIDVENQEKQIRKTVTRMRHAAAAHGRPAQPNNLWTCIKPEGINLGEPATRLWLKRKAQLFNADLVCIGPAYKLYFGGKGEREEDLARLVTTALDEIRTTQNCAIILEHHAPHQEAGTKVRNVRPIGSSLWLRWPEFGYGIRLANEPDAYENRIVDVVPWRGPRDERSWPKQLTSAEEGMPWTVAEPNLRSVS